MDNVKSNEYYVRKIISDMTFLVEHTKGLSLEEIEENDILVDSIMFRFIQLSENSGKLADDFKELHKNIPWRAIKGMRNKIVHEYGNVDLSVVYDTLKNDIPKLISDLEAIVTVRA